MAYNKAITLGLNLMSLLKKKSPHAAVIGRKGGMKTKENQPKGYYSLLANKRWDKWRKNHASPDL